MAAYYKYFSPAYPYRRRELAQNKAEPGKNWNSFETFIFITLRVSSYRINQDPGREKIGKALFQANFKMAASQNSQNLKQA